MARFSLIGDSYTSQSLSADAQQTRNWYREIIESEQGKSAAALYPTPGLDVFSQLAGPSVRGALDVNGRLFAVSGQTLYEIFKDGTQKVRGNVANDNQLVSMAVAQLNTSSGSPQLAIVSAGSLYVLNLFTGQFSIPPGPLGTPFQIKYADGFFALLNTNGVWQLSAALDATNWPGINGASVSIYPDQTIAMGEVHRELWFMSATHGAVYYDSGNTPIAYDLVSGGDFEQGIAAPRSMVALDNTMFWLGANQDGAAIVWRASGYTPLRVSNHAIEFAMQGYATISDAIAYGYQDQGHTFYVLYFPTPSTTWVYDVATQRWHERAFWNDQSGVWTAHRSQCHVYAFGMHLVGDWMTGNLYRQDISIIHDFGHPIKRVRRSPHISNENEWMRHHSVQIDMEVGLKIPLVQKNSFSLKDSAGKYWNITVNDVGVLLASPGSPSGITSFVLQASNGSLWQLGISTLGVITTTPLTTSLSFQKSFSILSTTGATAWTISVSTVGVVLATPTASLFNRIFAGQGMPTIWTFTDSTGKSWNIQILDNGQLESTAVPQSISSQIFINDPTFATTWQLGVDTFGRLTSTQVTFDASQGTTLQMVSATGLTQFTINLDSQFRIVVTQGVPILRNPQMMVRWSDDEGHTWSNEHVIDCGAPGNYKARAIIRRMGRSRDRVYEISVTDPTYWRLVDAFLKATPGYVPTERISDRIRKGA